LFLKVSDRAPWYGIRVRNHFAEPFVAAQISAAVSIDGDGCLTDLAVKKIVDASEKRRD
jgi:hypothetical protein